MNKSAVIIQSHSKKPLNGSTFYAFEYCAMLNNSGHKTLLIINISENFDETVKAIKTAFVSKYNIVIENDVCIFRNMSNVEIFFTDSQTNVMILASKMGSILFVDGYSYNHFKSLKPQKFFFCNEFYKSDVEKLNLHTKNTTKFYGYYDYQYHDTGNKVSLKIHFDIFKKLTPQREYNKFYYAHLLDVYDSNTIDVLESEDVKCKHPNTHIKFLYDRMIGMFYVQNVDIIDKNNRSVLEAQYHNIDVRYIDRVNSTSSSINIERVKSRTCCDFHLKSNDKLITDIINDQR